MSNINSSPYIMLQGLKLGNRFITSNDITESEEEKCKLNTGETVYRILGYADSIEEAQHKLWR